MQLVNVHCEVQIETLSAKNIMHFALVVYLHFTDVSHNKKRLFQQT
jgi:hypothetical protein